MSCRFEQMGTGQDMYSERCPDGGSGGTRVSGRFTTACICGKRKDGSKETYLRRIFRVGVEVWRSGDLDG